MDLYAVLFHPAEPGHLPLGKLVDGVAQEEAHLFVAEYAQHVLGYELVLNTVVHEVLGPDTAVKQVSDFFDEAALQPGV